MDERVTVRSVAEVGPDTVAIEFDSPEGFDARPGQFVKLTGTVGGEEYSRFYTLSSPDVEGSFEITVEVGDEAGPFSAHLAALEAGDVAEMTGPFGRDYYEGEPRVVVLAGGPGVGPAVGIGERALADGNDVAVVYRDDQPSHTARLDALREAGATVVVTDGDIDEHVAAVVTGREDEQVFVYGFAEFVDAATDALDAAGATGEAKIENFG